MKTKILKPTDENIYFCSKLLRQGEVVGVPTETVYGLAANAFNDEAVSKIFKVKGRPSDNPLICHVSSLKMFKSLTNEESDILMALIKNFWPGPFTVVVKHNNLNLSSIVCAGLDTVGIRFSSNMILNKLIDYCGFPLAAPSANISKKPSSTNAFHVANDFDGKIEAILDGGQCDIGVESTVVKVETNRCILLRPGFITLSQLERVAGKIELGKGILEKLDYNDIVESPGLKHKHYSPKAEVIVIKSSLEEFVSYVSGKLNSKVWCVVFDGEEDRFSNFVLTYGKSAAQQARNLFFVLRKVDELKIERVYFRCPEKEEVGFAVYNRLIRAANFNVIEL